MLGYGASVNRCVIFYVYFRHSGFAPEGLFDFLEYPQFLTHETRHVPDSIGRDAFSKVK